MNIGTRLGAYEITGSLGAGGMGEVYRARDTKLNRDVAIKVLPELFANDRDRLARFEREAQSLAALNHPHIAQIYGVTENPSALVMEFVDGEDLAARLARGPMPVAEALAIATQIADALEAAHERGIIHRDLKPANIKVTQGDVVKVLDFGLAKAAALDPVASGVGPLRDSPTFTSPAMTSMGMIIGTAAYMAPEQAKGKAVDRRADLWAFGCVLFEMLTGRRPFPGDDVTDTLATVLKSDPPWDALPPNTPPAIRRLLGRCLEKDPKRRLSDAATAGLELRDALSGADRGVEPVHATRSSRWMIPIAGTASALAAIAVAVAVWALFFRQPPAGPLQKLTIAVASTDELPRAAGRALAISPDARTVAITVLRNRRRIILRRPLDAFEATPIAGAEDGRDPFFNPDGRLLGVYQGGQLWKVSLADGVRTAVTPLPTAYRGAHWQEDGRIILGLNGSDGLVEVSASGGPLTEVFKPKDEHRAWYPQALPQGRVLFCLVAWSRDDSAAGRAPRDVALHVLDRATGTTRKLLDSACDGQVLATGHLVFMRDYTLWAVPFDRERTELRGEPVPVLQNVRTEAGGAVQAAVAPNGAIVFASGGSVTVQRQLLWVDRSGKSEALRPPRREYVGVRLSPDGKRAAAQIIGGDGPDIWVSDLALGTLTPVSVGGGAEHPVWTADSQSLIFSVRDDRGWRLVRKSADGTGDEVEIGRFDKAFSKVQPTSLLADGSIIVDTQEAGGAPQIGLIPGSGERAWRPLVRVSRGGVGGSTLSPDRRWLAYTSDEAGESQIYIQPYSGPGARQQVPGTGWAPTWSRIGGELLFLRGGPPTDVMRVDVQPGAGGGLTIGTPESLAAYAFYDRRTTTRFYDAPASGERMLFISRTDDLADDDRHLRIIPGFAEELRRVVPVR